MKSFVKFKYDRTDLHESPFVGGKTGQAAQTSANNPGLRKTLKQSQALDIKRALPSSPKRPNAPNVSKGESIGPQKQQRARAMGQKAGPAPTGIAAVMNRTKKKLQRQSNSEIGRKVGRGLQGAGKEILDYKADRERTDTGAGGMGTAMRQSGGITRAAVQGAMKAPSERINPKQKKTLGGKLGLKAKERFQRAIGVKPTARTEFGGKMTGDTSKQAETERKQRLKKGVTQSADTTGLSKAEKERKEKELASGIDQRSKKGSERPDGFDNRLTDTNKNTKSKGDKPVSVSVTSGENRTTDDPSRGDQKSSGGKQLNMFDNSGRRINKKFSKGSGSSSSSGAKPVPPQKDQTNVNIDSRKAEMAASGMMPDDDEEEDKKPTKVVQTKPRRDEKRNEIKKNVTKSEPEAKDQTIDVSATEVKDKQISGSKNQKSLPPSSEKKKAKATTVRRNVRSSEFKTDGKFDQKKYDAAKGRTATKSGGGRPRKIVEANRIAAEKEIKKQYGSVANAQMRSYNQMQKDKQEQEEKKKRKTSVMVTRQESYSHWREEFIWETDKKYPDKVKEIKPMTGKNTITINPEDETSKYKRGY